jgi:RING-H2 zinc finger domain
MFSFEILYLVSKRLIAHFYDPRVFYNWTTFSRMIEAFRDLRVRIAFGILLLTSYSGISWLIGRLKMYQSASFFLIDSQESSEEDCSICYDDHDQTMVHLPNCKHMYHRRCILNWLQYRLNCPMCAQSIHNIYYKRECE